MSTPTSPHRHLDQSPEDNQRDDPFSRGCLIHLRTKAEVTAKLILVDAYVVKIPLKSANGVVKCVPSGGVLERG